MTALCKWPVFFIFCFYMYVYIPFVWNVRSWTGQRPVEEWTYQQMELSCSHLSLEITRSLSEQDEFGLESMSKC